MRARVRPQTDGTHVEEAVNDARDVVRLCDLDPHAARREVGNFGHIEQTRKIYWLAVATAECLLDMRIDRCVDMHLSQAPFESACRAEHFEYQHVHTHTIDMPSTMPKQGCR